jgi:hypothetical protein
MRPRSLTLEVAVSAAACGAQNLLSLTLSLSLSLSLSLLLTLTCSRLSQTREGAPPIPGGGRARESLYWVEAREEKGKEVWMWMRRKKETRKGREKESNTRVSIAL